MGKANITVKIHIDEENKKVISSVEILVSGGGDYLEESIYSAQEIKEIGWEEFWRKLGGVVEEQLGSSGKIKGS